MIPLIVSLVYAVAMLFTARMLYRNAVASGFDVTSSSRLFMGVGFALIYALTWPLLLLGIGAVRFIVHRAKGDIA